jgi:hypothetical protein
MKNQSKLEEIFAVEDGPGRLKGLLDYARSLRVNVLKAKRPDGQYSEHELAVLIFDAVQNKKGDHLARMGFLIAGAFILMIGLAAIWLFNAFALKQPSSPASQTEEAQP